MVTRASSVPSSINKTGSEKIGRGSNKTNTASTKTNRNNVIAGTGVRGRRSNTPINSGNNTKKTLPRSRSLTNGIRKPSPSPNLKGSTSNISKPQRNAPIVVRSRGNEIGSADTLEIIATKSTGSDEPSTPEDNINVVVRVRPLNDKERNEHMVLQFPGNGQIMVEGRGSGNRGSQSVKLFSYNVVFEPGATQDDLLEYCGIKKIVEMAVEGFSCTAFCYGQTGSGKTHTLTGPPDLFIGKPDLADTRHGLIFRSFLYLFQMLKERETHFVLKASFLEIYNEKVIDLLNPGSARKPLAVRWSKKSGGFFVENLFTVDCEELDDLLAVLEEGMRNRSVGSHQMNEHSSRSHTILTVHIISEQQAENGVFLSKQGKINFVDLAGSEMTKKTLSEGKTLEEANNINKSLMVLGYCIASLSDSKKRSGHIPYRDSQLTKLLADSLAGNGVTLMIACVSPTEFNYSETLNTLRYASRAKRIRSKPIIIMDPREALILNLKRDINVLQIENEHLKAALNLNQETVNAVTVITPNAAVSDINYEREPIPQAPEVSLEKLAQLEGTELAELVKLYMQENHSLREENSTLFTAREILLRDQELVSRENERLLKKLEDVNRVCVRSPLITGTASGAHITNSNSNNNNNNNSSDARLSSSDIWTNPHSYDLLGNLITNEKETNNNKLIGENILEVASQFGVGTDDNYKTIKSSQF